MKKMLLFVLMSSVLSSYSTILRINFLSHERIPVSISGNWYNEQNGTIVTPFSLVNEIIERNRVENKLVLQYVANQYDYLELRDDMFFVDVEGAVLEQAIALVANNGLGVNRLSLPTLVQFINIYSAIGVSKEIMDLLIDRAHALSRQGVKEYPFRNRYPFALVDTRKAQDIPSAVQDHEMVRNQLVREAVSCKIVDRLVRSIDPEGASKEFICTAVNCGECPKSYYPPVWK